MAEDTSKPDAQENEAKAARKKPAAAKKKASAKKPAAKKPAAKKTTAKAAPAAKKSTAAQKKSTPASKKPASQNKAEEKTATATKPEPSEARSANAVSEEPKDQSSDTSQKSSSSENFDGAQILEDLKSRNWGQIITRALLMFFFGVLGTFALYIAFFLAFTQVIFSIFVGGPNDKLTAVMSQLSGYLKDVISYLSFASDELPFPFGKDVPPSDS